MQLCNETIDSGIKTLVMLDEQGEQLDRTLECNDRMHLDLKVVLFVLRLQFKVCNVLMTNFFKGC